MYVTNKTPIYWTKTQSCTAARATTTSIFYIKLNE